jgi:hypothetical protein
MSDRAVGRGSSCLVKETGRAINSVATGTEQWWLQSVRAHEVDGIGADGLQAGHRYVAFWLFSTLQTACVALPSDYSLPMGSMKEEVRLFISLASSRPLLDPGCTLLEGRAGLACSSCC